MTGTQTIPSATAHLNNLGYDILEYTPFQHHATYVLVVMINVEAAVRKQFGNKLWASLQTL